MSFSKEKDTLISEMEQGCCCDHCNDNEHSSCEEHNHDECDCGCGHHEHDSVTLVLDDNSELRCQVIAIFEIKEQNYIALLHPIEEKALLYRFSDNGEDDIEISSIEDDEEFELVAKAFMALQDQE